MSFVPILSPRYHFEEMIILFIVGPLIIFLVRMLVNLFLTKKANLPPGPYPWPIIGNLFQIGKKAHVTLAKMAQVHGPLISLRLGQQTLIVGSSPIVASEILKTHDHLLSARYVPILLKDKEPTVYNMNLVFKSECDDGWRSLRNIYKSEVFSSKAMESRVAMRENKVMEMVKYIRSKQGEGIIIKDVMFVTAINILSNTSLSIDIVDFEGNGIGAGIKDSVRKVAMLCAKPQLADLYPILGRLDLHDWYNKVMNIMECEFKTIWEEILQSKRDGRKNLLNLKDFMDTLIDRGFTDQQIYPVMEELFAAGIESLSFTTEWFVSELLKNQKVFEKAKDEVIKEIGRNVVKESDLVRLPFLEACFKETLRLHSPAPLLLPHKAMETCEVMGYTIPKDSQILVNVWAISRDPKLWDDPLSYKPDRFIGTKLSYKGNDFEYLPFGSGRRMCPAESMASKTIILTVASLIMNFEWFLPNNDADPCNINMEEEMHAPMYKKEPLHVNFKLREGVQ